MTQHRVTQPKPDWADRAVFAVLARLLPANWIRPERVAEPPGSSDCRSRPADRQDVSGAP